MICIVVVVVHVIYYSVYPILKCEINLILNTYIYREKKKTYSTCLPETFDLPSTLILFSSLHHMKRKKKSSFIFTTINRLYNIFLNIIHKVIINNNEFKQNYC